MILGENFKGKKSVWKINMGNMVHLSSVYDVENMVHLFSVYVWFHTSVTPGFSLQGRRKIKGFLRA
jgi:hypothetical protein